MSEHFISIRDAGDDLLTAAAYLAERIKSADGHASAMSGIVPRYLAKGNVDLAAELSNTVDDPFTRDKLLTLVAEKCAEIDDDEYAVQLAEAVEEFGLRSQAFEHIALEKVRKGEIEKALGIADTMQHPDFVYAAAAVHLSRSGRRNEGDELLDRIEYPNARVHALLAMALQANSAGKKDESILMIANACDAAAEIEHNEDRIRTLCDVGNHYVEVGRNDLAVGAYDAAKEEAERLDNIHRDAFIAAAVMGFLHAGSADTADRSLDLVIDKTQMASCLHVFAKYYWERGERDEALDALDESYQILRSQREMETRDSRTRFALFGTIAAQYATFEKAERAIEIASAIDEDAYRTAALTQVAAVLTIRGEDEHARHALNAITDDSERAFALVSIADAKEQYGDRDGAVALLDESQHLIEEVPQLTARSSAYNEIAARYKRLGEREKLADLCSRNLATISQIRDESSRAVALANLSEIAEDVELTAEDRETLERMLARVQ